MFEYVLAAGDRVLEVVLERTPVPARVEHAPIASTPVPAVPRPDARPSTGIRHQDRLRDGTPGPEMVFIRGGTFTMGSPAWEAGRNALGDEEWERQHRVNVGDVWIGQYAVTVGEFRRFVEASDYRTDAERNAYGCYTFEAGEGEWRRGRNWRNPGFRQTDSHPVVCVSWNDARLYVQWLSAQTGQTYRLPTEAEWEYAARAGMTTARFWGNDPDAACAYANVHDETSRRVNGFTWTHHRCDDRHPQTAPVGQFAPNAWGLHDMLGNVWELTCSVFDADYGGAEQHCDADGERRLVRGGSWFNIPDWVRSAYRSWSTPEGQSSSLGLRLARSP